MRHRRIMAFLNLNFFHTFMDCIIKIKINVYYYNETHIYLRHMNSIKIQPKAYYYYSIFKHKLDKTNSKDIW